MGLLATRTLDATIESNKTAGVIMLKDIVEISARPLHRLFIRFEDGVSGEFDVAAATNFAGVFAPLRDEAVFASVEVSKELGTVQWSNGADLDPDVVYASLTGRSVQLAA